MKYGFAILAMLLVVLSTVGVWAAMREDKGELSVTSVEIITPFVWEDVVVGDKDADVQDMQLVELTNRHDEKAHVFLMSSKGMYEFVVYPSTIEYVQIPAGRYEVRSIEFDADDD